MKQSKADSNCVNVALRVRPFVEFEAARGDRNIVLLTPGDNRIALSPNDYRTFDHVFGPDDSQQHVFEQAVIGLVDGLFDGYNATILAYGQTGSGKTYTMGSAFDLKNRISADQLGIIPRSVLRIFDRIDNDRSKAVENGTYMPECEVHVQFVEVYMDDIRDLLVPGKQERNILVVEQDGNIIMKGASIRNVTNAEQLMEALNEGSKKRTVASTKMNDESSRSHAIFSVHINLQRAKIQEVAAVKEETEDAENEILDIEKIKTKFHFVDLAGSECMDQTGAEGHVAKEGIDINMGLFHLGQVINALTSKRTHIPYRSCKLTRLLQDSLGGNSKTLMIACISPSSANERHSLSTLNYASNAKRIQNQITKNISSAAGQEAALRKKINMLEAELLLYKSGRVVNQGGQSGYSDLYKENLELTKERDRLKLKVESLTAAVEDYQVRMVALSHREVDAAVAQRRNNPGNEENDENDDPVAEIAKKYIEENHKLSDQYTESQKECEVLRRQVEHLRSCLANKYDVTSGGGDVKIEAPDVQELIAETVRRVNMLRKVTANEEKVERIESIDEDNEDEEMIDDEHASDEEDEGNTLDYSMEDQENDERAIEDEKQNERDLRKLVDVNADITSYQKIIDDLVESLKRQAAMQTQYDAKCRALSEQIINAEKERDRALEDMKSNKSRGSSKESDKKNKQIINDYERKIKDLKKEHARIKSLEKSLQEAMKKQQKTEADLKKYRDMVTNLQKIKTDLKTKMDADNKKAQETASKANKKIRELEKEANRREIMARKTKSKDQRVIEQLNRQIDQLQQKIGREQKSSKIVRGNKRMSLNTSRSELNFRTVANAIMRKASMIVLNNRRNRDIDALVKERTELENKKRNLDLQKKNTKDLVKLEEIQVQIDSMTNDWGHLQKQIKDHLAQMEDVKDDIANNLIDQCHSLSEAKYVAQGLCEEFLKIYVEYLEASQECKDAKAELIRVKNMLETEKLYDMFDLEKVEKPQSILPDDPENNTDDASVKSLEKERRRTKLPQDLLFDNKSSTPRDGNYVEPLREVNGNSGSNTGNSADVDRPIKKSDEKVIKYSGKMCRHTTTIRCLDSNDLFLASGSVDRSAKLTDITTGEELAKFAFHENAVDFVKFVPNTTLLITGSGFFLRIFDLRTQEIVSQFQSTGIEALPSLCKATVSNSTFPVGERPLHAADVDIHGHYLYTGVGTDGIRCYDMRSCQVAGPKISLPVEATTVAGKEPHLNSLCANYLEDGSGDIQLVATHNNHPSISVVRYSPSNLDNGVRNISSLRLGSCATKAIGIGNTIFCGNSGGRLYRFSNSQADFGVPGSHSDPISSLSFIDTSEGSLLVSACNGGIMNFWKYEGIRTLFKYSTVTNRDGPIYCTTSNSTNFFVAGNKNKVSVFSINRDGS